MMDTDKNLYRYPGTKPFEANEYKLFKGRDEDIQKLQELISLQNLVILYSRSGLGKSSLLNAGLVNKFKEEPGIVPLFVRFGAHYKGATAAPRERLISIIREEHKQNFDTFLFQKLIPQEQVSVHLLWYLFKSLQISDPVKNTFVLIFDQFEELFTYPENEIEIFKKELSELLFVKVPQQLRNVIKDKLLFDKDYLSKEQTLLLYEPLNIKILFAIRSDKMSLLNKLTDYFPSVLKYCYELNPLTREQAKQAIVVPASLTDQAYISPPFSYTDAALTLVLDSLTDTTRKDVSSMTNNCQEIETFQLQIVCKYAENLVIEKGIREVSTGDFGNIKEIFENHYRNIINKLSDKDRLPARRLIEEKLIIDGIRVSMPIPFILRDPGMSKPLLDELITTHIIRPEQNNTVEISHDTLIEPVLKYYAERKKQEEVENQLREKEAEIQRIRSEQEIQAEKQRQKARRNRLFAGTVGIFLAFSILLFLYALTQKNKADKQTIFAQSNFEKALAQEKIAQQKKAEADFAKHVADSTLKLAETAQNTADDLELYANKLKRSIDFEKKAKEFQKNLAEATVKTVGLLTQAENNQEVNPTFALRVAEVAAGIDSKYKLKTNAANLIDRIFDKYGFYKTVLHARKGDFISTSHDGKKALTASQNGEVHIWEIKNEVANDKPEATFRLNNGFKMASFSEDDERVVAADTLGNLIILNVSNKQVTNIKLNKPDMTNVYLSKKGIAVISEPKANHVGKRTGLVEILDPVGHSLTVLNEEATCAAFSPSGDTILTGNLNGTPKLWNRQGTMLKKFSVTGEKSAIVCLAYSNNGEKILAGYADGNAVSWDVSTDQVEGQLPEREMESLTIVRFKDNNNGDIFIGTQSGKVEWFSLSNAEYYSRYVLKGHSGAITSLGIHTSPDRFDNFDFFTGSGSSNDRTIRVWHNKADLEYATKPIPEEKKLKAFLSGNQYLDVLTQEQRKNLTSK